MLAPIRPQVVGLDRYRYLLTYQIPFPDTGAIMQVVVPVFCVDWLQPSDVAATTAWLQLLVGLRHAPTLIGVYVHDSEGGVVALDLESANL